MPLELIILIALFSIPMITGAIRGFTSNTMTQNYIPSYIPVKDVDSEIEPEMEWGHFSLSDPLSGPEEIVMETPPSISNVTEDQSFDQKGNSDILNVETISPGSMRSMDREGEMNRFFSRFNKPEAQTASQPILVEPIQDESNNDVILSSVSEIDSTLPVARAISVLPDEVGVEVERFLKIFKNEELEPTTFLEDPHYVDQMLSQINSIDIPPPTEEDIAAESPLSEVAFKSIVKNYGFETASQITTTPFLGAKNEEDIMIGRIQFYNGETCLVYEDNYVCLRGSAIEKVASNEGIVVLVKGFFFDDGFIVVELNSLEELFMQEAM